VVDVVASHFVAPHVVDPHLLAPHHQLGLSHQELMHLSHCCLELIIPVNLEQ